MISPPDHLQALQDLRPFVECQSPSNRVTGPPLFEMLVRFRMTLQLT